MVGLVRFELVAKLLQALGLDDACPALGEADAPGAAPARADLLRLLAGRCLDSAPGEPLPQGTSPGAESRTAGELQCLSLKRG